MNAKQTPLVDILRLHAEDLHSDYGHNKSARLLSQAADEIEALPSTISRLREYADHKITCGTLSADYFIEKQGCDCGYDELMAELEETK